MRKWQQLSETMWLGSWSGKQGNESIHRPNSTRLRHGSKEFGHDIEVQLFRLNKGERVHKREWPGMRNFLWIGVESIRRGLRKGKSLTDFHSYLENNSVSLCFVSGLRPSALVSLCPQGKECTGRAGKNLRDSEEARREVAGMGPHHQFCVSLPPHFPQVPFIDLLLTDPRRLYSCVDVFIILHCHGAKWRIRHELWFTLCDIHLHIPHSLSCDLRNLYGISQP